jgi:hypothetical protein
MIPTLKIGQQDELKMNSRNKKIQTEKCTDLDRAARPKWELTIHLKKDYKHEREGA